MALPKISIESIIFNDAEEKTIRAASETGSIFVLSVEDERVKNEILSKTTIEKIRETTLETKKQVQEITEKDTERLTETQKMNSLFAIKEDLYSLKFVSECQDKSLKELLRSAETPNAALMACVVILAKELFGLEANSDLLKKISVESTEEE